MNVIPKSFRIRINRAAHDQALRHEMQLRDKWTAQLSEAMQCTDSYDELQALIARIESGDIRSAKNCASTSMINAQITTTAHTKAKL